MGTKTEHRDDDRTGEQRHNTGTMTEQGNEDRDLGDDDGLSE